MRSPPEVSFEVDHFQEHTTYSRKSQAVVYVWFVSYSFYYDTISQSSSETERYYNYSGAPGARITLDQSVHKSTRKPRSSLSLFLSLLLFHVPSKRLEMLDKLYVDHQVKDVAFKAFASKLVDSWQTEVINVSLDGYITAKS